MNVGSTDGVYQETGGCMHALFKQIRHNRLNHELYVHCVIGRAISSLCKKVKWFADGSSFIVTQQT